MNPIDYNKQIIDDVADSMIEDVRRKAIFATVDVPNDCGECPKLGKTPDASNTGDSPTIYRCTALHHCDCPEVDRRMERED